MNFPTLLLRCDSGRNPHLSSNFGNIFPSDISKTVTTVGRYLAGLVFWLCAALLGGMPAYAGGDTPASLPGVIAVDAQGLNGLVGRQAVVVDTRALHDYLAGHLPGAHHVDYRERSARDAGFDAREDDVPAFLKRLAKFAPPARPVVFYCNGPACWKSYKAAAAAQRAGYREVYWFRGGLADWKRDGGAVVAE